MAREESFSSVLDELEETGRPESVSAGEIIDAFEHRSLGVLLTLLGLITILPIIGDVPGAAILTGTLAVAAVTQSLWGRRRLWAPEFVRRREIGRAGVDKAVRVARPWVRRVDRLLRPRLRPLIDGPVQRRAASLAAALLAASFYPLAFVPFGVNAPALGVIALGLGLMASDGLMVLLGYGFAAATIYVGATALL